MVLYLSRIRQCGSHIGTLMHLLAVEPRSIAGLFFHYQYLGGTIFRDPVFDGVGLAGYKNMVNAFLLPLLLSPFLSLAVFPFSSFILWVYIAGLGSSD